MKCPCQSWEFAFIWSEQVSWKYFNYFWKDFCDTLHKIETKCKISLQFWKEQLTSQVKMNLFLSETYWRGCSELTCLTTESLETARLSSSGLNLRTLMQKWRGWEKASSCGSAWETESSLLIKISPTSKYNLCLQLQSCRAETGQWTIWQKNNCKSLRKQFFFTLSLYPESLPFLLPVPLSHTLLF